MDNKQVNLSVEEQEWLIEVLERPGYKVLLKVLDMVVQEQMQRVVQYNLENGSEKDLSLLKSRYDGAAQAVRNFQQLLIKLKRSTLE